MPEQRLWKKVSQWGQPDPSLGQVLVRHVTRPEVWTHRVGEHIPEDKEWVELDIPIGTSPPPVDEKLDEEAFALFDATQDSQGYRVLGFEGMSEVGKYTWRKVAKKARELHAPQWRPMSELEDDHQEKVLIRRSNNTVVILANTFRRNDFPYRAGWMELPS